MNRAIRTLLVVLPLMLGTPRASASDVFSLQLLDAGPNGLPVIVEGEVDGLAAAAVPQWGWRFQAGTLTAERCEGGLTRSADLLRGRLKAMIRPGNGLGEAGHALDVVVEARIGEGGVVEGTWRGGEAGGKVAGLVHTLPPPRDHDRIMVVLDCPYPNARANLHNQPGSWQGNRQRLGFTARLVDGQIADPELRSLQFAASWYPGRAASTAYDASGRPMAAVTGAAETGAVEGGIQADGSLRLTLRATVADFPTTYTVHLQRSGALWHGLWTWQVEGLPERSGRAAARLGRSDTPSFAVAPAADGTPRTALLRHALALAGHPALTPFREPVLVLSATSTTGDKQYDNAAYNLAGGIYTGLLLARLSEDPRVRAEGLMMARNAAAWWDQRRHGGLGLAVTYKGMSWMHAWAVESLAALAAHDEGVVTWPRLADAAARSMIRMQREDGSWTWFEHDGSGVGVSNHRHNRSVDDRSLPFGELLLAFHRLRGVPGALDTRASEEAHHRFLTGMFADPPEWFYFERSPEDNKSANSLVGWFQWLVETGHPDRALIDRVQAAILDQYGREPILQAGLPRFMSSGFAGPDVASSARFAHALARRGDRAEAEGRLRAILALAHEETGLIDHAGRRLPGDMLRIPEVDFHPYTGLKAAIGWELLQALEILEPGGP